MLTKEQLAAKREYLDNLEPSVGRTAAYQLLADLEDQAELVQHLRELLRTFADTATEATEAIDEH